MSQDIFVDWKNSKFVVAPKNLVSEYISSGRLIILTDFSYWTENIDILNEWCNNNNCVVQGMTVHIPDEKTLTLFSLTWG